MARRLDSFNYGYGVSRGLPLGDYTDEQVSKMMKDPHGLVERHLTRDPLGTHWGDIDTALTFATGEWSGGGGEVYGESPNWDEDEYSGPKPFGMVISGYVHPRHLIDPESEERYEEHSNPQTRIDEDIIRHGSRVHLNNIQFWHDDWKVGEIEGRWHGRA